MGVELLTAAAGQRRSFWGDLPVPETSTVRLLVLIGLLLFFLAAMALEAWSRPAGFTVALEDGAVVLPERAVHELVERAFATHPDVVRARAVVRSRRGCIAVAARVYLRPAADAARLEPIVRDAAIEGLRRAFGFAPEVRRLDLRVLTAGELHRHL